MKNTLCVFTVILAAIVCVNGHEKFIDDCEVELGYQDKIVSFETYQKYYPCILACAHEKMDIMVNNKILPEKYCSDYIPSSYGVYGEFSKPKLLECIIEANDQGEKCAVEWSLTKCIYANWRTIFPHDVY